MSPRRSTTLALALTALAVSSPTLWAADDALAEKAVALLEARCFKCHSHSAGKNKGGLVMDSLAGLTTGATAALPCSRVIHRRVSSCRISCRPTQTR